MKLLKTEQCNTLPDWATDNADKGLMRWYKRHYVIWQPRFLMRFEYETN